jgi:RimJ/RimL family protein N-acetyltransferase
VQLPYEFQGPVLSERFQLRLMNPDTDIEDVFAYQSREDVCRYLPYEPRSHAEVTVKVTLFSHARVLSGDGDYWQLAIDRAGRVIGDVYFTIKSVEHQTAEIGWSLHPDFHRQGYMREAARIVLGIAFEEIGVHRVMANLDSRNDASAALCRRLGMREEAHFVEDWWSKGEWTDSTIFGMLERDFTRSA